MTAITIRPDVLAHLDALAGGDAERRDELVNAALERFVAEQAETDDPAPAWHVPLVRDAVAEADRGDVVAFDLDGLLAQGRDR